MSPGLLVFTFTVLTTFIFFLPPLQCALCPQLWIFRLTFAVPSISPPPNIPSQVTAGITPLNLLQSPPVVQHLHWLLLNFHIVLVLNTSTIQPLHIYLTFCLFLSPPSDLPPPCTSLHLLPSSPPWAAKYSAARLLWNSLLSEK